VPILETRDLIKHYRLGNREVPALNGVTLQVEHGTFLAIMGRSGSGKSTLLNLVGCLDRPTNGEIVLGGVELTRVVRRDLPRIRRKELGFVFQHFHLLPTLTALENVMLPLRYDGIAAREARSRANETLEAVSMGHRLGHRPTELSGGESQRVAIARALVNRPRLVLADEPTGDLDTETASSIIGLMKQLNHALGQTFLIVTHDPMVAQQAGRIICLKDGRIESDCMK